VKSKISTCQILQSLNFHVETWNTFEKSQKFLSHAVVDSKPNTIHQAEDTWIAESLQMKESEQDCRLAAVTVLAGLHSFFSPHPFTECCSCGQTEQTIIFSKA